jgi:hypothetical protein
VKHSLNKNAKSNAKHRVWLHCFHVGHYITDQQHSVYAGTAEALQRYSALAADFKARYGQPAELFARAPGRVNIIGEHVDYEGCAAALSLGYSRYEALFSCAVEGSQHKCN